VEKKLLCPGGPWGSAERLATLKRGFSKKEQRKKKKKWPEESHRTPGLRGERGFVPPIPRNNREAGKRQPWAETNPFIPEVLSPKGKKGSLVKKKGPSTLKKVRLRGGKSRTERGGRSEKRNLHLAFAKKKKKVLVGGKALGTEHTKKKKHPSVGRKRERGLNSPKGLHNEGGKETNSIPSGDEERKREGLGAGEKPSTFSSRKKPNREKVPTSTENQRREKDCEPEKKTDGGPPQKRPRAMGRKKEVQET